MSADARSQTFFLLNKLQQRKHTLDYYLEELDRKNILADKRERALLNALVFGTLRWRGRLDYVLQQFASKPLNQLDVEVLNILRLALFQIMFMDKIPTSAAVNTAVEITKKYKPQAGGFVNAVLRKASVGYASVGLPDSGRDLAHHLSVKHALPQWLVARWLKRFGQEDFERIAAGLNELPPLTLRVNTLKTTTAALSEQLKSVTAEITDGCHAPDALRLMKPACAIPELPGYNEGFFIVQDEAAQLTTALVKPQPEDSILDVCAGLGGKTLGMTIAANNQAVIVATDITASKLNRIEAESARLGLTPPVTQIIDWLKPLPEITALLTKITGAPPLFDKVLVDAPCSGLGVLRRNPDTKWNIRISDLNDLARQQLAILTKAAFFVKPDGILIYTVCSTEPEETTAVLEKFIQKNNDFFIDNVNGLLPENFRAMTLAESGFFCTYPLCSSMDGFFMAALRNKKLFK